MVCTTELSSALSFHTFPDSGYWRRHADKNFLLDGEKKEDLKGVEYTQIGASKFIIQQFIYLHRL